MSDEMKKKEEAVFAQELNDEELKAATGGRCDNNSSGQNCTSDGMRDIYWGGFPNCAATVESGSWCWSNDACESFDVRYYNMGCFLFNCTTSWK